MFRPVRSRYLFLKDIEIFLPAVKTFCSVRNKLFSQKQIFFAFFRTIAHEVCFIVLTGIVYPVYCLIHFRPDGSGLRQMRSSDLIPWGLPGRM